MFLMQLLPPPTECGGPGRSSLLRNLPSLYESAHSQSQKVYSPQLCLGAQRQSGRRCSAHRSVPAATIDAKSRCLVATYGLRAERDSNASFSAEESIGLAAPGWSLIRSDELQPCLGGCGS